MHVRIAHGVVEAYFLAALDRPQRDQTGGARETCIGFAGVIDVVGAADPVERSELMQIVVNLQRIEPLLHRKSFQIATGYDDAAIHGK